MIDENLIDNEPPSLDLRKDFKWDATDYSDVSLSPFDSQLRAVILEFTIKLTTNYINIVSKKKGGMGKVDRL